MKLQFHIPHYSLQPYIQGLGIATLENSGDERKQRIDLFPTGYSVLNFAIGNHCQLIDSGNVRDLDKLNFAGQMNKHQFLSASQIKMVFVLFKPNAAFRLLGVAQQYLLNESPALRSILGSEIDELIHKMEDHSNDYIRILEIIQNWLIKRLEKNVNEKYERISFICDKILQFNGNIPIRELNHLSCMSKRSMEQHFKEQVGVSPKIFSRIIRFNKAYNKLHQMDKVDWMQIVEEYNYYDQSHFIHEFKTFFGYSPSQIHLSKKNISDQITTMNLQY